MNTPLLSLVILGYSNFDVTTHACLRSLVPWLDDSEIEILVVDNGSTDGSAVKTAAWCNTHATVKCLLSERNLGFAGGMNWGAKFARGQWLLLVNNDTVFPPLALDALKKVVSSAPPDVAMLGPVTNAAGNGQRLWRPEATHEQWLDIGRQLHENPSDELMPAYRCDFFCIAIRHDVWNQLNGLDLDFGLGYYEDFDFSLRLRHAGYRQLITEDVFILHLGSATFKGSLEARALIKKNKRLLQRKHPNARFEHTRLGNLTVLKAYRELKRCGRWSTALNMRESLRYAALAADAPKSWFKRFLWVRRVARELGARFYD